jgi:hypothetical protein
LANLGKLPKISDVFTTHINSHRLVKNEWTPCPRCGGNAVQPPTGKIAGAVTGGALIGCWLVGFIFISIILGILFWPLAIIVLVVGLVMIPFLPLLGASMGAIYRCNSCKYFWTFKDIEKYKAENNLPGCQLKV